MIIKHPVALISGLVGICTLVGVLFKIEGRFESKLEAQETHQALAQVDLKLGAEREIAELRTELKLIDLELKQLRMTESVRALTEDEIFNREYLRQRRIAVETRLLDAIKI